MADNIGAPVQVTTAAPPRGGGTQAATQFYAQSMRGSFAFGVAPATATLAYAGLAAPVTTGALVNFRIGAHYFAGICKSDTEVTASNGQLRTLEFHDLRYFLTWDWVFGAFNLPDVRLVGGRRLKRYKHLYPADYPVQRWTYTLSPLPAWQILDACLRAPTVFTQWRCNLIGNGLFPGGLLNGAIYDIDASSGMRLDAVLALICEKTGLTFCHDPRPGIYQGLSSRLELGPGVSGDYRLTWVRKGYGVLPLPFPVNSDQRRLGQSLSENATNVCVLGGRNQYQILDVPMVPDWAAGWEQFIEVDLLAQDLFDHEINPLNGLAYNAYPADPEQWRGANDAKARALEITVGEYVALREARVRGGGQPFVDQRKYAGRWRMDLPAALYIERLLFRAFKPDLGYRDLGGWHAGFWNAHGQFLPLDCAPIADQLLCRVFYDPVTGAMSTDNPPEPVDGNGVLIAKGYQLGEDLFRLVQPDRMNADFFSGANRLWSQVQFQIDDSGEGVRFVLADAPVFVSDSLLVNVDNCVVLNAAAVLQVPPVAAALVFEAERFTYWAGNGIIRSGGWYGRDPAAPLPGRNRVEPVGGLAQEFVVARNRFTEIPYADNLTAGAKAAAIANNLLLNQSLYLQGGYELKWDPRQAQEAFGTALAPGNTSQIDRLEINTGPGGLMEVVDFTMERQRDRFEPERELDRRSLQNSLFPGQQELRQQAQDQRRFNAVLRQTPERLFTLFRKLLRGEADANLFPVKFVPGAPVPATLPCGAPVVRAATAGVATPPASLGADDKVFMGVTVRQDEPTAGQFYVQRSGDTPCRVKGPVAVNDPIGLGGPGAPTWLVKGGTPAVGIALEAIDTQMADGSGRNPGDPDYEPTYATQLIQCRLGTAAAAGKQDFIVDSDAGDFYWGRTWDGLVAGTERVKVAKHQDLRCTPAPAGGAWPSKVKNGVTYTYTYNPLGGTTPDGVNVVGYTRDVTGSDGTSTTSKVVPVLNMGDIITASPATFAGPSTLVDVQWQAWADGRAWTDPA